VTEKLLIAKKFLKYQFIAKNAQGIHSPFVLKLFNEVIAAKKYYYAFDEIEDLRKKLFQNHEKIQVTDLGAGSKVNNASKRKISSIAKIALNDKKAGQMLFRLVEFIQPKNIIELGTSLGINTLYLATPLKNNQIFTFEGCPNTLAIAKNHFKHFKANNIETIEGDINHTLSETLQKIDKVDMVIFDANHQKSATIKYFEQCLAKAHENSVFIFDDIYWSAGMMAAWEQIKAHQKVTMSIDLFDLGIVFFSKNQTKQHFILKF